MWYSLDLRAAMDLDVTLCNNRTTFDAQVSVYSTWTAAHDVFPPLLTHPTERAGRGMGRAMGSTPAFSPA